MQNLVFGILYGILGQVGSFMQLQGGIKYNLYPKYTWLSMLAAIPLSWFYLKSVQHFIKAFDGQVYPSRLLGFGIGIIIFTTMSWILFKEPINDKTIISLILALGIFAVQIFWK
jgi:multidrug transporter EmrE-like cation transporter